MALYLLIIAVWMANPKNGEGNSPCNISLSSQTNLVDLGSRVTLKCQVCPASSEIIITHNGTYIADYTGTVSSVVNISLHQLAVQKFTNGSTELDLTIKNFTRSFIGIYTCYIPRTTYMSSLKILNTVPVDNVTLTPAITSVYVLENVKISYIRCVSSVGRPAPNITWYLDNRTSSDYTDDVDLTGNSSSVTLADATTSNLTITPTTQYNGTRIYCNVSNGYGIIPSNSSTINVLTFPTKPTIAYTKRNVQDDIYVIENNSMILECLSTGNPEPNIFWRHPNSTSSVNNNTLTLESIRANNQGMYTCTSKSSLSPTNDLEITSSKNITIFVHILHPPSAPACQIGNTSISFNTIRSIRGELFAINCTSRSNPPPLRYTWTLPVGLHQNGQQLTIPNVQSSGTNIYSLEVINEMNATFAQQVITGNVTAVFQLEILFPAIVQSFKNITILLNETLTVACPYTAGNPPKTSFMWTHVNTSHVVGEMQNLTLKNIKLTDEGYYTCRVNNTMDPTGCNSVEVYDETTFYVDVQYAANIKRFYAVGFDITPTITINENQTVMLFCEAESDPFATLTLVNNTGGGENVLTKSHNNTISASVVNARCEFDMGVYQCQGNNTHNAVEDEREIEILITCAPRSSPFMQPISNVWTKTNMSVILTYTIVAYPPPNNTSAYVWQMQILDEWTILYNTSRIQIHISEDRLQTNLSILQVHEDDFGNYTVSVDNGIGSTQQIFVIQANEEPSMPQQVRVLEDLTTASSVTIEWKPGFDGGDDQWFVIGYKKEVDEKWTFETVSKIVSRMTISELVAGTTYEVKMYAENSVGKSEETPVIIVVTRANSDGGNSSPIAAIGGGVGGCGAVVVIIVVVVVIRKRRNNGTSKQPSQGKFQSKKKEDTVYENSLFRLDSEENVAEDTATSIIDNPTYKQSKDTSLPRLEDRLQRTPSFVIVPEPLYGNSGDFKIKVRSIQIQELRTFTLQCKQDPTDIYRDFYSLDTGLKYETSAACTKVNVPKNRYRNMYPYDKNRVVLPQIEGEEDSDFINASFIDGYETRKKYIAAQGPLERTIHDIWRMIVAENIQVVAMVTNTVENEKRKCFQYWPDDTLNPCQYGDLKITLIQQEEYTDFVIRKLQSSKANSKIMHTVYQCHFTAWPDKDVPDTALSLLQFWRKVRSHASTGSSPWLVHCSAGVGRTGTFIALDYLYDQGKALQEINVFDAVKSLREQRINMVQTKNQYLYLHEVLCEALDPIGSVVQNKEYLATCSMIHSDTGSEFKRLREAEDYNAKQAAGNDTLAVEDRFRPMLLHSASGEINYTNAVYVSTFREQNKLILTPSATKDNTDVDFLWLLHDYKLTTVVILNEQVEPYIPDQGKNTVTGPFSGKLVSKTAQSHYTELLVRFQYYAEHDSFDVRVFHFTLWPKKAKVCKKSDILHLLIGAQNAMTDGPVVVQCRDGFTHSGLFVVLWCIVERIKRDGDVAVAETVRMTKRRCQRIIPNEEQYRFCHEFAKEYAEGCMTYENT